VSSAPCFAVVGHPNKGKSSVVATLAQNDSIAIAMEPGTTRQRQAFPLSVDGEHLYTLIDTPGFQRPRRALAWLQAHSASASDRAETVAAFVKEYSGSGEFADECELLSPLIEGAGIIYVVDGSVPYSPEQEAEMSILRWTGRPSLALINSIGPDDHGDAWQAALGQFFQVVRRFDAVHAPFEQHLGLLRAFGQLEPDWEQPLSRAVTYLQQQREAREGTAARLIAEAIADIMLHRETRTLPSGVAEEALSRQLEAAWYAALRQREARLRRAVEELYAHQHLRREEQAMSWHAGQDLFSERSRELFGVSRRYLATVGFAGGALGGVGIDALTVGSSFGLGALTGGVIGAAGALLYGDRLLQPARRVVGLGGGLHELAYGPAMDIQLAYVVLGRAVDHWWCVSRRNHAGRDPLALPSPDSHWLEQLPRAVQGSLQSVLARLARGRSLDGKAHQALVQAIDNALDAYAPPGNNGDSYRNSEELR